MEKVDQDIITTNEVIREKNAFNIKRRLCLYRLSIYLFVDSTTTTDPL